MTAAPSFGFVDRVKAATAHDLRVRQVNGDGWWEAAVTLDV